MKALCWAYYALAQGAATAFFWLPTYWHHGYPVCPPVGLTVALALCMAKAWDWPYATSIKVLPGRKEIDGWPAPFNRLWGNPEDGASGADAIGSWSGFYNPDGTRWLAICWNCRNWLAGFNYLTWPWASAAPNYQTPYTVPKWVPLIGGTVRTPRLGWQQLPASDGWTGPYKCRMVCSL